MVPENVYVEFFQEYQKLREEHNFIPELIFNIDETMVNLQRSKSKVVVFKNLPKVVVGDDSKLEHLTLLLSIPAKGDAMKPHLIVPRLTMPPLTDEILEYYDITGTSSGWIDGDILKQWIENQFLSQIYNIRLTKGLNQPALVILDNHTSRLSIDTTTMWDVYKIKFLFIPPHTSHVIQPLDLCPNGTYKGLLPKNFKPKKGEYINLRRNGVLSGSITALKTALSAHYVQSGWRRSGLFPFNPEMILKSGLVVKTLEDDQSLKTKQKTRIGVPFNGGIATNGELVVVRIFLVNEQVEV